MFCSWFFNALGYPKLSKPSLLNGVAMASMFFLVRIAVIPAYYSHMYSVFGTEDFYRIPLGARCAWVISSVSLDIMNIMWMRRIIRGCLKVLRSAWLRKAGTEMESKKTDWREETDGNANASMHKLSFLYHIHPVAQSSCQISVSFSLTFCNSVTSLSVSIQVLYFTSIVSLVLFFKYGLSTGIIS